MTIPENDRYFSDGTRKPLKVVFCLPGKSYSSNFLKSWSDLLFSCFQNNIIPIISQNYSPVVYWARNLCLGGDVLRGVNQKPFGGLLQYDYIMWIDSDMVFVAEDFFKLLNYSEYDILSGMYKLDDVNYSAVLKWDESKFLEKGYFEFIKKDDLENIKNQHRTYPIIPVSYNGFGFMLIKKGVFESIQYPWFEPMFKTMLDSNGNLIRDFTGEDVSFCLKVQEKGFKVMVDTSLRLGHEKSRILT